jgi:acyl-CoA synthetase (NDP forming)
MKQANLAFPESGPERSLAAGILEAAQRAKRYTLGLEVFSILKAYGIPVVKTVFAKTEDEALRAAEEMGYPVVMKVVSPQISHKSDVGGIRLSL